MSTQVNATFSPTLADLPNPERGWYGWNGADFVQIGPDIAQAGAAGQRLLFAAVDIGTWRDGPLPADWLARLSTRLDQVRAAGMKVVLRLAYDWTEAGNDAPVERIQQHLAQLKPLLAAQASAIAYMQAGFIGAWGEWHSSKNNLSYGYGANPGATAQAAALNRLAVRDALLAAVPASVPLQVRYPEDLMRWYPLASQQGRIGVHNDCFLAGPSDSGTYDSVAQRDYTRALSERVPLGGETCHGEAPLRQSCRDILTEGKAYHLAYLNAAYDVTFMDRWRAEGCHEEVSRSMGYRFQLDALSHPGLAVRGASVRVDVDLRNLGWSRITSARPLVVQLRHRVSGALFGGSAGDARDWAPQAPASTRVAVNVAVPAGAASGEYDVLVSLPDVHLRTAADARFAVRFANADVASAGQRQETGAFATGTRIRLP